MLRVNNDIVCNIPITFLKYTLLLLLLLLLLLSDYCSIFLLCLGLSIFSPGLVLHYDDKSPRCFLLQIRHWQDWASQRDGHEWRPAVHPGGRHPGHRHLPHVSRHRGCFRWVSEDGSDLGCVLFARGVPVIFVQLILVFSATKNTTMSSTSMKNSSEIITTERF